MKISVVVVTFNAEKRLQRCIDSFAAQTHPDKELIIVDGGSKDSTPEIMRRNSAVIAASVSEKDQGIYDAMNKGIRMSTGEWVCFLGADDCFWSETTLADAAIRLAPLCPPHRIVYGKVAVTNSDGDVLQMAGMPWEEARKIMQHEMSIPHQGTFHHRSFFEAHGLYDISFRIAGDYELLLRELKKGEPAFLSDLVVARMELGGVSSLPSSTLKAVHEFRRARKLHGMPGFSFWLFKREARARTRAMIERHLGKGFGDVVADLYRVCTGKPRLWTRHK